MIDTLRSLHFGTTSSSLCAFSDLSLESEYLSLSSLLSQTLFAGPQAKWPPFTQDNAVLMIILILNQILTWAREMSPLTQTTLPVSQASSCRPPFSLEGETHKCLIRIQRSLDKWEECYMEEALPETRALYFFCRMHICAPHLYWVAVSAQYGPLVHLSATSAETALELVARDAASVDEAAHFAWLVLEHTPEVADVAAIWMPIILYYAGLIVWRTITSQGVSRSRGSLRVLHLFEQKLSCMPWPCCTAFVQSLEALTRT